jgi:hypothetical protein
VNEMEKKKNPSMADISRLSKIINNVRLNSSSDDHKLFGYKKFEKELDKLEFDQIIIALDSVEFGEVHKRYQDTAKDMQEREERLRWTINEMKKLIPPENLKMLRQIEERALFPHREEEFLEAVRWTFGDPPVRGWQAVVCETCGVTPHELRQWLAGRKEIPEWAISRINEMPYVSAETAKKKSVKKLSSSKITSAIVEYFDRGGSKKQGEIASELGISRKIVGSVFDNGPSPPSSVDYGDGEMSRYELWTIGSFLFGSQWTSRLAGIIGIKQHTLNVDYFFTYGDRPPRQISKDFRYRFREAYWRKKNGEEWETSLEDLIKRAA